ncbi:vegetative cell wall gp1 protein [Rutstroemia sp. NJR-2017a BVV2]|nr:vegetative cell wall gp1 protein [Rutstroemia sp. NJR-2017a BVV2]
MSFSYTTPPGHPGAGYYPFPTSATPSPAASPTGRAYTSSARHPLRTHSRHTSYGGDSYGAEPRPFSPRYTSGGYYATGAGPNVSRNKSSWSSPPPRPETKRQYSHYPYRTPYESDEENEYEDFEYQCVKDREGRMYWVPIRPAHTTYKYGSHGTDKYCYQSQKYAEDPELSPYSARRQSSAASTPQRPPPRPATTRPMATPKSKPREAPPKATEADARKHHIPPGYSLKNWDPTEEPIMLLGSVFDANSLGKWIYDWTVYHHGPATPLSDMAGELWLLLIQLAGKVKRAEECMPRIRRVEDREMVEDFIISGERLTDKLKALLKACEAPMLKAGRKGSSKTTAQLGKNAGTEFVDSIFGRDRQLDATEKFMSSIRLWNMRFDANCEDILRRPGQYE